MLWPSMKWNGSWEWMEEGSHPLFETCKTVRPHYVRVQATLSNIQAIFCLSAIFFNPVFTFQLIDFFPRTCCGSPVCCQLLHVVFHGTLVCLFGWFLSAGVMVNFGVDIWSEWTSGLSYKLAEATASGSIELLLGMVRLGVWCHHAQECRNTKEAVERS